MKLKTGLVRSAATTSQDVKGGGPQLVCPRAQEPLSLRWRWRSIPLSDWHSQCNESLIAQIPEDVAASSRTEQYYTSFEVAGLRQMSLCEP